ncbi:MAG: ferredoxin family protein [Promethearchaeia archaeon]|nr:MAG: ferredoxin family protein [Candidatus Lokiarchaeia archaeon]
MGVDREYIDWYPTIDFEKCNNCGDCVEFCAHGVYKMEEGKLIVENPKNCVVFCQACMRMCPHDAMIFQSKKDVLSQIKKIKAELKKNQ